MGLLQNVAEQELEQNSGGGTVLRAIALGGEGGKGVASRQTLQRRGSLAGSQRGQELLCIGIILAKHCQAVGPAAVVQPTAAQTETERPQGLDKFLACPALVV